MNKNILLVTLVSVLFSGKIFAEDISGTWQQIDDKSGAAKAIIKIYKAANDSFSAKIIKVTPRPGYTPREICNHCPSPYTNQPILGMEIIKGLKHVTGTNTYEKGRVIDPLAGKVYDAKIKMNATGKRLTLRAYMGVSTLGRSQTWIRLD
ncbi:DUF2147 domain-containing protein [Acinetobacter sp.]|uniref:DUF2147 domain-containing protein n=1 Tax=Acinetobacter sp. TaxID=472 RepID=UPI00388EFAD0